jgi:zinc protease
MSRKTKTETYSMTSTAPDRLHAPAFGTLDKVEISEAKPSRLSNKIPVYQIDAGPQDLVKIELIFPRAGASSQPRPLVSVGTSDMLEEGTRNFSSAELAEQIDYYGAFTQMEATLDFASVCLYTLNKHLSGTIPLLEELVKRATFPEADFQTYIHNKKEKFFSDEAKAATVARKKFTQLLFGDIHPYGHYLIEKDFDGINRSVFADFYRDSYTADKCHIVVSGKIDPALQALFEKHFGGNDWGAVSGSLLTTTLPVAEGNKQKKHFIERKEAVQSAIRIGRLLFNKKHADYLGMQVLNTVLGGYFGSRLMSNIREDKGYTYGIGSGVVSLKLDGYFFISTEVGVDVCANALKEIYFELQRLTEELIPEEELDLVRNYMVGTFLRSADGPFSLADKFKGIFDYGLDYSYYQNYIKGIKNISPVELRDLAIKYFRKEDMVELVVGKM